jgi:polyisoprenoid-binding protein YceI
VKVQVIRLVMLAGSLLLTAALPAIAADWKMDPAASRLEFSATFEQTVAPGEFRQFDTRLRFDADQPAQASLEVTIAVNSADMKSGKVNEAIGGGQWFDFSRFPQARFQSTDIRRIDATRFVARGTLNLKGVQQAVEVPFAWYQSADAARMQGELVVKRSVFGIGTGEWAATNVIGPDVKIRFDVRLQRGS